MENEEWCVSWGYHDILGQKHYARKISNIHKDFELYQAFMCKPSCLHSIPKCLNMSIIHVGYKKNQHILV